MKITPDNFAEVADITFGEGWIDYEPPLAAGQTEFQRTITALAACKCSRCGDWWECDEAMEHPDYSDSLYCVECAEKLSRITDGDDLTPRQRDGFEEIYHELTRRVTFRTIDEARADRARFFAALEAVS